MASGRRTPAWKRKASRELVASIRKKRAAKVETARKKAKSQRDACRKGKAKARAKCRARKKKRIAAARRKARTKIERARAVRDAQIQAVRESCAADLAAVERDACAKVVELVRKYRAERAEHRELSALEREAPQRKARSTARERRAERDEEVAASIPEALLPTWRRYKRHIKAKPGISRLEAFLQWVEENPSEVLRYEPSDSELARAELDHLERLRGRMAAADHALSDVPF